MSRARLGIIAVVLAVALAACAGAADAPDSGVEGRVWVGPMCPVVQQGVECPDRPLEAELEVVGTTGRTIARARSDADGRYRIPLAEGSYELRPVSPGEAGLPFASPVPFEVAPGAWLSLDIHFDSGIR